MRVRIFTPISLIIRKVSLLIILLYLTTNTLYGGAMNKEEIPVTMDFIEEMKTDIPGLMNRYDVPGLIVGVIREGRLVWKEAFGYADISSGTPLTTEAVCRMESLSKPITAVGVMHLSAQGLIDLDAPVVDYLYSWNFPPSAYPVEEITWRMLLSNTSGLPLGTIGVRYSPDEDRPELRQALMEEAILDKMPGNSFYYSNTGFNLLEMLVEEVTKMDFSMYMQEEILEPLGMKSSGYRCKYSFAGQVPTGYDSKGRPIPLYVYPEKGAGGLFSTLEDYSRFLISIMQMDTGIVNDILGIKEREDLYAAETKIGGLYGLAFPGYGLGHFIEPLAAGEIAVSHGGQGSGWMTHFHLIPERGDGIIILCNSQRSWPLFAHILQEWGDWNGAGRIGMSRIIKATKGLWIVNGVIVVIALWLVGKVLYGIYYGSRTFTLFESRLSITRIINGICGFILAGGWLIAALQDYLFITAVFPVAAAWLGYGVLLLSAAILLQFLFPKYSEQNNRDRVRAPINNK